MDQGANSEMLAEWTPWAAPVGFPQFPFGLSIFFAIVWWDSNQSPDI